MEYPERLKLSSQWNHIPNKNFKRPLFPAGLMKPVIDPGTSATLQP